ncbi:MAG: FMN-binding protein [Clostridia bacterium]|nr:FMN-binding protein [Clostridia bacterium]
MEKEKKEKSLLKDVILTTLVLVLIAVIAGGLLAAVNKFTHIDEAEKLSAKLASVYTTDKGFTSNLMDGSSISGADASGSVLGAYMPKDGTRNVILHASGKGAYKGTVEIIVIIEDYNIKSVAKYVSNETPGLGSKAFEVEYLDKYKGDIKDIDGFELAKNGGTIDAVSGATKTSTALVNAVNAAVKYYKDNIDAILKAGGQTNE